MWTQVIRVPQIPGPKLNAEQGEKLVARINSFSMEYGSTVPSGVYVVQTGDTLTSIAKDHGTSVAQLQWANGLANPNQIKAGDVFLVP
jgi:LysM repeat protein